jgi:hypothetical protein
MVVETGGRKTPPAAVALRRITKLFVLPATHSRKQMTKFRYPNRPRIAAEGRLEYFKRFANYSSKLGTERDSPKVLIYFINFDYCGGAVYLGATRVCPCDTVMDNRTILRNYGAVIRRVTHPADTQL